MTADPRRLRKSNAYKAPNMVIKRVIICHGEITTVSTVYGLLVGSSMRVIRG